MKNLMLKAFVVGLIGFSLTGCEAPRPQISSVEPVIQAEPTQQWTHQPLENSIYLKRGMTEAEAIQVMNSMPVNREFLERRSVLQWCDTGSIGTNMPYDRFLLAFFTDERLTEIRNLSNKDDPTIFEHVAINGGIDCAALARQIKWLQPAQQTIEIRNRNMNFYQ